MAFNVRIGLDLTEFEKLRRRMEKSLAPMQRQLKSLGATLSKAVTGPIIAAGAAATASAVQLGNYASTLSSAAAATGLSTTTLQEFEHIARNAGTETRALSGAAEGLTRRLRATGDESAGVAASIDMLGVNIRDAGGNIRSMEELMPDLIGGLAQIENVTERNALAMRIFGRRASLLAPVLDMGSEAIEQYAKEAHELGLVLDSEALAGADRFRIQFENLNAELKAVTREVTAAMLPVIEDLVGALRDRVVPAARAMAERVRSIVDWWQNLNPVLQSGAKVLGMVALSAGPVLLALSKFVQLIPAATAAVKLFGVTSRAALIGTGIGAALVAIGTAAYMVWDNWDYVSRKLSIAWHEMSRVALRFAETVLGAIARIPGMTKAFPALEVAVAGVGRAAEAAGIRASVAREEFDAWREAQAATKAASDALTPALDSQSEGLHGVALAAAEATGHIEDLQAALTRIDRVYDGFAGRDQLGRLQERARELTTFLEGAYGGDFELDASSIARYRSQLDALNVEIGEMMAARARMAENPLQAESFLPGLDDVSVRLSGLTDGLGVVHERALSLGEAFATAIAEDMSYAVGRVVEGVLMMEDGFRSLSDTLKSFGEMAQRIFARLIADITAAVAKAAALRGIATLFGIGTIDSFGSLLRGALGFGGARAMGGPVMSGQAYVVGERGPELFVPPSAGNIIPNHALGAGRSGPIDVRIRGEFVQRGGDLVATIDTVRRVQGY